MSVHDKQLKEIADRTRYHGSAYRTKASVLETILCFRGLDTQLDQLTEECGELIVAVNHYRRIMRQIESGDFPALKKDVKESTIKRMIQEMCDVEILTEQLKSAFLYSERRVNDLKEFKLDRELNRIKDEASKRTTRK